MRQIQSLYARGNVLARNFRNCNISVKTQLFKTYCTNFYCGHLWSDFSSKCYNKLRVAYNNVFRALFNFERDVSISSSMLELNINHFSIIMRKQIYNFMCRLESSENLLIYTILTSKYFRRSAMHCKWTDVLYT